ncbi:hypothetical protein ACCS93_37675 [Rhizobium ruizarguesonis]
MDIDDIAGKELTLATDDYDDTYMKSGAKSRFSFRKMAAGLFGKIVPNKGKPASAKGAASDKPTNSNRVMKEASARPSADSSLPDLNFGLSLTELIRETDIGKLLPETVPPLKEEQLRTLASDKISAKKAGRMLDAADRGSGKSPPVPRAATAGKAPSGVGNALKLSPSATGYPREPSAQIDMAGLYGNGHEPEIDVVAMSSLTNYKPVTGDKRHMVSYHELSSTDFRPASRAASFISQSSGLSIDSTVSDGTTGTSVSIDEPAAPKQSQQDKPAKDGRTRPLPHQLYEPGLHTPGRGR